MKNLAKLLEKNPRLAFRVDDRLNVVAHLKGNLVKVRSTTAKTLQSVGIRFVKEHSDLFGKVTGSLRMVSEADDAAGGLSITLQQYHGKHRVEGGSIRLHRDSNRNLDTVRNRLFPDLGKVSKNPRVNAERAVRVFQNKMKSRKKISRKPELLVFRHEGTPRLAWKIFLEGSRKVAHGAYPLWVGYVDAVNGKLLHYYDNLQTVGAVTGNGTGYYSGAGTAACWDNGTTFQLRDTTRTGAGGPEVIVNDEDGASPSEDSDNNWNSSSSAPRHAHQGPEVDAQRFAGAVVDYYQTVHGRNSFDGAGANMIVLSHFGNNLNNGYWDGTQVKLGDGDGVTNDYECSDDWLAHEFTHAYTEFTCGLAYWSESGALNEAFSDVFAAFITGDWLVFEDSWLGVTAPASRNMIDPTNGGNYDSTSLATVQNSVFAGHQPSHWDDRFTGTWDNAGVHINSGIINHLFYLLTVGGTHATSGVTVTGIGQAVAEQLLFRCMTVNLVGQPNATFLDFREAMLDACLDLFPTDLLLLSEVKRAFNAVGIGPDLYVRDNVADTGEEPYAGTYLWASPDIINRTSPSSNPAVDFANLTNDSLWENVEAGQDNHVYIRLQNRGNHNGDATVNVYFSAASTFAAPSAWIHIGTLVETAISPGSLRIAGPLVFPSALIPGTGHYCMIAVVTNALDPAPDHNLIASISDYLDFVRNANNIAYRNMDVVDLVPGTPGHLEALVARLPGVDEPFDLRLDLARFVPGARIRIRIPVKAMEGARLVGLKLIDRGKRENIYEVMAGRDFARNLMFLGKPHVGVPVYGIENLRFKRDFKVRVEYVLPPKEKMRSINAKFPRNIGRIVIRQEWKGEPVGAVGHQLVLPQRRRIDLNVRKKRKRKKL